MNKFYFKIFCIACIAFCLALSQQGQAQTKKVYTQDELKKMPKDSVLKILAAMELEDLINLQFDDADLKKYLDQVLNVDIQTSDRVKTQKSDRVPATVITISDDLILKRGYISIWDVLKDLPDFKLEFGATQEAFNIATMRGLEGMSKFIILMDGIRISSPTNERVPLLANYPVHLAKQIEVVYGPASALYGADAFAGVINIITKKAEDINGAEALLATGMYGQYNGGLTIGKKLNDKISFTLSGHYSYDQQPNLSNFYNRNGEFDGLESLRTGVFNTAFGTRTISTDGLHPEYQMPLSTYAIHAAVQIGGLRISGFRNQSKTPTATAQTPDNGLYNASAFATNRITVGSAVYEKKFGKLTSTSMLIASRYDFQPESGFQNLFTNMQRTYKFAYGRMYKIEQLIQWSASDQLSVIGGATYENFFSYPKGHDMEEPSFNFFDPSGVFAGTITANRPAGLPVQIDQLRYANVGGFLQVEYSPIEKYPLLLTLGGRYDYNTRYDPVVNPRFGVVWQPAPKTTVKAMHGWAYLAPSPLQAYEQFGSFSTADGGATFSSSFFRLPNPKLQPQTIKSSELHLKTYLSESFSVSLTGHHSVADNLFTTSTDVNRPEISRFGGEYLGWPVSTIEVRVNEGRQTIYGGTLQLDYFKDFGMLLRGNPISGQVRAYIAASLIDGSVDPDAGGPQDAIQIAYIAPFSLKTGFDFTLGRLFLGVRAQHYNEQRVPNVTANDANIRQTLDGYTVLNLNLGYQFSHLVRFFVNIDNLTDARYRNIVVGAAPDTGTVGSSGEFAFGAPQNPLRVSGGLRLKF
ncbi:TonB-dependent receptor plug domain-containing protein [Microscilla marina]|uniref:TonB-dependent receptor domain protein n=1 Tax=Microscilla marina ATCC 23134 TaxID=313606 RepID=A1ZFI1_MICM2|nr:TonB-dependent receptor [Microscilla marina]EAY30755.1 TonB-dependent receptor domain protein [Microscilla marina ATCC 23134]